MDRPSKEWIEEIRRIRSLTPDSDPWEARIISQLLTEIDALEAENKCFQFNLDQKSQEIGRSEHRGNTVDYIYDKLEFYSKQFGSERVRLKTLVAILRRQLELTGNACGLAKTFLMFHGKPSQQLDNCAEIMEKHEELAFECLSIIDEADIILNSKEPT